MSAPPDTEFQRDGKPHEQISQPTVRDREISQNNFGAGYYQSDEVYQQTQRFKRSLNANASVGKAIERLAVGEAIVTIARSGFRVTDEDGNIEVEVPTLDEADTVEGTNIGKVAEHRTQAIELASRRHKQEIEYGRRVYEELPDYLQEHALLELSSLDERFDPPEMRVTKFFHEASRSKGGRLMDNVFGRVKKLISPNGVQKQQKNSSFFGRGGSQ